MSSSILPFNDTVMDLNVRPYWGYHYMVNARGVDLFFLTNYNRIYDFTKALVKEIDMVAYGEPQIVHFGIGDKEGFTLNQLIETSNITAHFVNALGHIYLDVFSCKNFNGLDVDHIVREYFWPMHITGRFFVRDAELNSIE